MAEKSALLKYLELKEREEKSPLIRLMDSKKERGQLLSSADMNEDRKIRDIRYESMKETVTPEEAADRVKSVSFQRLPQQSASQQFINQNDVNGKKVLAVPQNNREALAKNIAESDLASYRKKEAERAEEQKKIDEARPVSKVQEDLDDIDKNIKKAKKDALLGEFSMLAGNPYPREQATERLNWLEGERDKYADELEFSRYAEYEKLRKSDDYEVNSKYSTTAKSSGNKQAVASLSDYGDWRYEYINQNPAVVAAVESGGTDVSYLKEMSDDEVGLYNYLYKTNGKEAAEDYIDSLQDELYIRKREQSEAKYSEFAKEHPVLASAASVPMNMFKGIAYAAQAADDLLTGEADPNAPYNAAVYNTNAIRSSVSDLAKEKWGKPGSFAYGLAMSMADFLAANAISGGTGAAKLILGSGAAADTTISAIERGVDSNAAVVLGATAGVIEALTEEASIEALFKGDWTEKAIKHIFKNIVTEGSEEGASTILNTIADILISGNKSEWEISVAAYMDDGYSEKDAFKNTFLDKLKEIGLDVLGGAISGGLMSGGSVAIDQTGKAAARADEKYSQFETLREAVKQDNARREFEFTQDGVEQEGFVLPTAADTAKSTEAKVESDLDAGLKEDAAPRAKTYEETVLEKKIAKATTTAERSGLRLGVSESDIKTAKSLGLRTGRNVVFYSDASEAGKKKDGYINHKTNTIYVNKDAGAQKATAQVLGHELSHSTEGTEAYDLLEQKALESLIRKGINPDVERERIKQLYERAGIDLATDEQVDGEIVAKYVEENLINNRAAIRELVRENPSAARKFKMALAKMLTKVTGNENYIDYKTISSMQKMIDDAAKEEAKAAKAEVPVTEAQPAEAPAAETKVRTEVPVAEKPVVRETPAAEAKTEGVKKPTFETAAAEETEQDTKSKADEPMPSGADEYLTAITQRHEAGELTDEEFEEAYTVYEEMRDTGVPFDKSSVMVEYVEGKIPEWVRTHIKEPISGKAQKEMLDEGVQWSVSEINGENVVVVHQADAAKLMNEKGESLPAKVRSYLTRRFRNQVLPVGENGKAYIRREGTNEYTNPAKRLDEDVFESKMHAASDFDELLAASEYIGHSDDDGRHPDAVRGWDTYRTTFLVEREEGEYTAFTGDIKVKLIERGDCFYDITNIKNITNSSAGQTLIKAAGSIGDASVDSIAQSDENVNNLIQYSVSEDESTTEPPKSLQDVLPTQAMSRLRQAEDNLLNSFKEYSGNKTDEFIAQMGRDIRSISSEFIRGEEDAETALNSLFEKYKSATTADEYLWQYTMFSKDIKQYLNQLNSIKRYADSRAKAATPEKARQNYTVEDAEKMFDARRDALKNLDRAKARALLTEEDKLVIGQIKRGERTVDQLNPAEYNVEDIRAVAEAEMAFDEADKLISIYKKQIKAGYNSEAEDALKNIKSWKDKATLAYYRERIDRNFRDIIPDKAEAEAFIKQYIKPVDKAEADKQRALADYRERVKALNLNEKPAKGDKVSESYAVQLLGEAEDNIRILEKMRNPETKRDGKTLEEWKSAVELLWADNPSLDETKIRNAVESFRQIYDDLLKQMNQVLLENGYPPVRYRSGYFPHFTVGSEDAVMAKFARAFGIKLEVNPLPTSINGLTQDFKPGKSWFGHALERTGFETTYDAVAGFEQYIGGALDVIYHTKNIQRFRALESQIRWLSADEGMRKQHQEILNNETLTEEQRQNEIRKLYEDGRYRMSNLVNYIAEYTNRLANKKLRLDRSMEELFGRKFYTVMQNLESRVAANMIGANIGSALTNIIPLNQAGAIIGNRYVLRGLWDTMQNVKDKDGFVAMSDFLVRRRSSVALGRTNMQKFTDVTGIPMQLIDDVVSEAVVRAAYYKNLKSGMSEETALEHADEMAASIMADRSKGALPLLFDVKNPAAKLFTQFQVEVNNEFSVIFKDIPREAKEKGVAMLAWLLFKYFVGAKIFNDLYEKLLGRRPAFDPLEMVNDAVGGLTGYQLPNALDLFEGDAWTTVKRNPADVLGELETNVKESLPFFGGVLGGGRVPIQSAFPDFDNLRNATANNEWSVNKRLLTAGKELMQPAAYLLPPTAGGFGKKLLDTVWTAARGGAYNVSQEGEYGLKYPFYTDTAGEAVGNVLRSIFSGPSATTGGVEWVESGFSNLTTSETKVYKEMLANGETQHKAWDTIWKLKKTSDDIEKCNIIAEANLSYGATRALFESKVTTTQGEKIKAVTSAGVSFDDFLGLYAEYKRINGLSKDPLVKTAEFDKYVNKHFKNESQRNAITSVFEYSASKRSVKNYKELIDAGIGEDHAFEIASAVAALEPVGESQNVTSAQKARAVIDTVSDDDDRMTALGVVLSDSDARKYRTAADMGVDADTYTSFREALPSYDADGNGSYTHTEIRNAIDAISGIMSPEQMIMLLMSGQSLPESYTLTNEQKAVMWQLATGSKSAKNNPYSVSAGEKVIKYLEALGNE